MIFFSSNDVIEYAGDEYLVLKNFGVSGTVAAINDGMTVVSGFRWKADGEEAKFVRKVKGATDGMLPDGDWKYVRFAGGTVDFVDATDYHASHEGLVSAKKDVPPLYAGEIRIREGRWMVSKGGSISAELTRGKIDEDYIQSALGRLKYDPEYIHENFPYF